MHVSPTDRQELVGHTSFQSVITLAPRVSLHAEAHGQVERSPEGLRLIRALQLHEVLFKGVRLLGGEGPVTQRRGPNDTVCIVHAESSKSGRIASSPITPAGAQRSCRTSALMHSGVAGNRKSPHVLSKVGINSNVQRFERMTG